MLFNSITFLIFFPVVTIGYYLLSRHLRFQNLWLLAASLFFYSCWDWRFRFLLPYFLYSGFTDITRCIAKLLGFELVQNFNLPSLSSSPKEFWTRWHINLSTWIRNYLYIPLRGMTQSLFIGPWTTERRFSTASLDLCARVEPFDADCLNLAQVKPSAFARVLILSSHD